MEEFLRLFLGQEQPQPRLGERLSPEQAMRLALSEAWKGIGRVSPNPMVGCVILSADNAFLGKGYHARAGGPHAEIAALADLAGVDEFPKDENGWKLDRIPRASLQGAKVYVTLEPCAHTGKTPSCAKTLASLPIKELIYGLVDPHAVVAGQGLAILRQAGIRCQSFKDVSPKFPMTAELLEVCEHFLLNIEQKRPFVSLKVATSLDGVFGLKNGESQWITGEESRLMGHFLRGVHDAILVGRGTVERDNPAMNIRHPYFSDVKKKLVVVDTNGSLFKKPNLKIFKVHKPENLIWAVGEKFRGEIPAHFPVKIIRVPSDDRGLDLGELQKQIFDAGIRSLYIEGGGKTLSAHLRSQTADRLFLFQAPVLLGALNGRTWTEGFGVDKLSQAVRFENLRRMAINQDQLMTGRFLYDTEHTEV